MTIKDRAVEWCNSIINRLDTSDLYRGYIHGAVEQRDIDIDKAIEWVKYGNENGGCLFDGWEKSLRKAMEDEK